MKKFICLFVLTVSLVTVGVLFPVNAIQSDDPNGIYTQAIQMTENSIFSSGGTVNATCPYCEASVSWEPLSSISSTQHIKEDKHYYLAADLNNSTYYHFYKNACLHLNGHSITSSARAIYVETGAALNIMGDGTVTGKGLYHATCDRGGAVDNCGTLKLFGGTYKHTGSYPVLTSRSSTGGISIYDGTLVQGSPVQNGSNVRLHLSYLNVYGGVIENGIAEQGGNVYGGKNAKVTIAGGKVTGGTVYMAENSASLTLSGAPEINVINLFDGPKADISGLTAGANIQIVGQGAITQANSNIDALFQYLHSPNELVKLSVKDGAVFGTVDTTGDSVAPICDGKTLKILCLTSSFGLNTTELLYDIAVAEGFEEVIVARLYASGCTLKKHVDSFNNDVGIYWYTKFTKDGKEELDDAKLLDGLLDENWNIIYIQQGAEQTPQLQTYVDYLDQLMDIVNAHKTNLNAKFIWNQTWAFQHDNPRKIFTDTFQGDQLLMHEAIIDAMQEKILTRSDFCALIPTGAAVQNARSSYFGDRLTKDTLHLNNLGRVIGGYTVLATVLDKDLTEVNVGSVKSYDLTTAIRLSETDRQVVIESVNHARANPFAVYQSKYTPEYLNGISAKANALTFTGNSDVSAHCPYCEKAVVWKALTNSTANKLTTTEGNWGHYYLAEDLTYSTKYLYAPESTGHDGYCLHLNGHNLTSTGKRALWVGAGSTMNIMGSGTVCGVGEGSAEADWRATAVDITGHINLFGGIYTHAAARPVAMIRSGAARINLFDGATIQGDASYTVSPILLRVAGAQFNMWGGTVEGGKAANGGSIHISNNATFNMFGGTVRNGYSTSIGGNIYASKGTVNIYSGSIYGGKAENASSSYGRGGNVAIVGANNATSQPAFYMYGGVIGSETVTGQEAGYASAGGANLYVAYGAADILGQDALISGGYGKSYGGNIMIGSKGYVTLTKGTIQKGNSNLGGNVYAAGTSSHFTMNGGTVANGAATESGGNLYINNGYFVFAGGTSQGGTAPTGANLHLKTGKAAADNYAQIHQDTAVSETAPVISGGNVYCEHHITLGTFTAQNTDFTFADTALLHAEEGLALTNAQFNSSLVDLDGHDSFISGTGSATFYDSANEDFKTYGTLALTGVALENPGFSTVSEKDYYALEENGSYSFHRLDMQIVYVSLRPSASGMYYTGKWTCDSKLSAQIDSFGVVVSTNDMPDSSFATEEVPDSIWTVFAQEKFESGVEKTGVMVRGILKSAADGADADRIGLNAAYANKPIFATAYIVINGDTQVSDGVSYSLYNIISSIDNQISQFPQHAQAMKDFLAFWKENGLTGEEWNFDFEPNN